MKTKIIAFIIAAASVAQVNHLHASTQSGWGSKETQRTILGTVLGTTIGGIVGHQSDKRDEGMIIGGVLGTVIGNRSGAGHDSRREQERVRVEHNARQYELARKQREQQRRYQAQRVIDRVESRHTPVYGSRSSSTGDLHSDPEVVAARQRAEKAEYELQRQLEARRRQQEKQMLLEEYARRAQEANQALYTK